MSKWSITVAALVVAFAVSAQAADPGSKELVDQCRSAQSEAKTTDIKKLTDSMQCLRYIEGFLAGASMMQGPRQFCAPTGTTLIQEVNVYVSWMDKHPDTWTQLKQVTVLNALTESFPCQK
jgi:hypothetical protein